MASWENKNVFGLTSHRFAVPTMLLFFILAIAPTAIGASTQDSQNDWRASVKEEALNIYLEASTQSKVVKSLKKGDVVIIELEIVSMDGTWCGVRDAEQLKFIGYVQGLYLEREPSSQLTAWQYLPPPPPPEEVIAEEIKPNVQATAKDTRRVWIPIRKTEVKGELDKLFISKFGRSLPVSAFGQTGLHRSMNFNHTNSFDIAVHPDSSEGRAILAYLRSRGLPYIAFRSAVRGSATGPHIHVGNPSPRIY
jgi:hypothetical protein